MMTLVLTALGTSTPTELLPGNGREDVDALGLERGGDVVAERGDFFQLHAGRGMQFVTRDGGALGDVAEGNFNIKLRQRLLHEAGVGHQFFFGLRGLDRGVGQLEKIERAATGNCR